MGVLFRRDQQPRHVRLSQILAAAAEAVVHTLQADVEDADGADELGVLGEQECPLLPYEAMDSHTILYDLIYNPDQTLFMRKGAEHGADVKNGLEMLLLQAFASWEFWHGKDK